MNGKRIKKLPVSMENCELIELAKKVAVSGGDLALNYFRIPNLAVKNKKLEDFDPVTEADLKAELLMREIIEIERPTDSILGEERGFKQGSSAYTWVIDPIDGTRAFIAGVPVWTVLVSVTLNGEPILGVMYQPFTKELFIGGLGISEYTRPGYVESFGTSKCEDLQTCILFTTFPEIGSSYERSKFDLVKNVVKLTRYGIDSYAYGLLALGQIDVIIEAGLKPHDILAPISIIESAGGVVTDWRGRSAKAGGQVLACGNSTIHNKVLELISLN